jgi:hypothetical protein
MGILIDQFGTTKIKINTNLKRYFIENNIPSPFVPLSPILRRPKPDEQLSPALFVARRLVIIHLD